MSLVFSTSAAFCASDHIGELNGGGGVSSNAAFYSIGAVGLPCPVGKPHSTSHWISAGTLASFLARPNLDFDGDGIPDEDDRDDDGDGLHDVDELTGVAFTPPTTSNPFDSDSDDDGSSDGEEATAGTDPDDDNVVFRISEMTQRPDAVVITWQGREGISYDLVVADSPSFAGQTVAANVVAAGGTGTWYQTTVSVTNVTSESRLFYRIRIHE